MLIRFNFDPDQIYHGLLLVRWWQATETVLCAIRTSPVVIDGTSLELGRINGSNSPRSESCPSFDHTPEVRQGSRV